MKNEKFVSAVYRMFKAFPADTHNANNNIDTAEYLEKYGVYVQKRQRITYLILLIKLIQFSLVMELS